MNWVALFVNAGFGAHSPAPAQRPAWKQPLAPSAREHYQKERGSERIARIAGSGGGHCCGATTRKGRLYFPFPFPFPVPFTVTVPFTVPFSRYPIRW